MKMTFLWFLAFNTLCSLHCALSIKNTDLITALPGQPSNVNIKQYSGYIVTNRYSGRALFYYFVEAQSKNKLSLPLTLWLGGGFLCSSFGVGVFAENGPFRPGKDANLIKNDYSWNLESNMLYVDSPAGSSFSYSNTSSDYKKWNETKTAIDNMKFLLKWFQKFPEYRNLDFYITGDGYGGHLAPQLATLLLEYNQKSHAKPIKLKGIALGNPFLDIQISLSGVENMWYRGIASEELLTMQKTVCSMATYYDQLVHGKRTKACRDMMDKVSKEMGIDLNIDDMIMPSCVTSNSSSLQQHLSSLRGRTIIDPCLFDWVEAYLNKPQVQKALHANTTRLPYLWDTECSGHPNQPYPNFGINIIPILAALLRRHVPILLYSGDQDIMMPVAQTRKISYILARKLKFITLKENGPWFNGVQIGGWSQTFGRSEKGKNVTYLIFASIKGASHFAPFSSPSEALTLFKSFLKRSSPPRRIS